VRARRPAAFLLVAADYAASAQASGQEAAARAALETALHDMPAIELLQALDYAHRQGIVHRDIKPANVMLDAAGRVKLTDFGVARVANANQDRTMPGTLVGTPSYMSPEQILGLAVGSRADIFAAGVILYQFLTGERPFSGAVTTIMHKVLKEDPLPPSVLNATLPPAWDGVVKRAIAKNPSDRYQTAAQFAADVAAVAEGRAHSTLSTDATLISGTATDATQLGASSAPAVPAATSVNAAPASAPPPAGRSGAREGSAPPGRPGRD